MSDLPIYSVDGEAGAGDALEQRCQALGLPAWRLDASGAALSWPTSEGPLGWLGANALREVLLSAASVWAGQSEAELFDAFEGCWLLPLVENERRRRAGYRVVIVASPQARGASLFQQACGQAGLAPDDATLPGGVSCREDAQRLLQWLRWTQVDLDALRLHRGEVGAFSRQLAESYEEISLLYRLGRSMNQVEQPHKFVSLVCRELHSTMSYRWVAVRFVADRGQARGMALRTFVSGDRPLDAERFNAETARLLSQTTTPEASVIGPDSHTLSTDDPCSVVVQPIVLGGAVIGAVLTGDKVGADREVSSVDMKLLEAAAGYLSVLLDNAFLYEDQQAMFVGTLEALTASIDAKDPYTCGHSHRVAELAAALARAHGLDDAQVERIRMAGIVHDVGKIGVPEAVLCKTGRLTQEEFEQIKQHPEIGYQILRDIPQFKDLLPGVLYHHERIDGRGYPKGLRGDEIPLMARIIGLVDSFDAMSSNRTYRSAMPRSRVYEELGEHAGTQFDAALVKSFNDVDLSLYDELVELHQSESAEGGLHIRRRRAAA